MPRRNIVFGREGWGAGEKRRCLFKLLLPCGFLEESLFLSDLDLLPPWCRLEVSPGQSESLLRRGEGGGGEDKLLRSGPQKKTLNVCVLKSHSEIYCTLHLAFA